MKTVPELVGDEDSEVQEIKLFVPPDRYRAFQRCLWIQVHESGRTQLEVMKEVVDDFLIKHQC